MTRTCALLLWGLLAACAGTETGNPSFEGRLGYASYSSDPRAVALRVAEEGAIAVTAAWLVLGDVRFADRSECQRQAAQPIAAHALGAGDHAREGAAQTPLELASGRYCGVRLPLLRTGDAGAAPPELAGHSILIEGILADGRRFALRSAREDELFLEALSAEGFEMNDELSAVTIGFDVAVWLEGLAWDDTVPGDSGMIEVDADRNAALLETFEQRIGAGTALFRDPDATSAITDDSERLAVGEP